VSWAVAVVGRFAGRSGVGSDAGVGFGAGFVGVVVER
jgi:hypothetical protein